MVVAETKQRSTKTQGATKTAAVCTATSETLAATLTDWLKQSMLESFSVETYI